MDNFIHMKYRIINNKYFSSINSNNNKNLIVHFYNNFNIFITLGVNIISINKIYQVSNIHIYTLYIK